MSVGSVIEIGAFLMDRIAYFRSKLGCTAPQKLNNAAGKLTGCALGINLNTYQGLKERLAQISDAVTRVWELT